MVFTIDFLGDGAPLVWSLTGTLDDEAPGWEVTRNADYAPALYAVAAHGMRAADPDPERCLEGLLALREDLFPHPDVTGLGLERRRPGYRMATQPVLGIEVSREGVLTRIARLVERRGPPGQVPTRAMDVDFSPEFRYCLDEEVSPAPSRPPTVLSVDLSREAAAAADVTALRVGERAVARTATADGRRPPTAAAGETTVAALETLRDRLAETDPDVLAVERGEVVPLVAEAAADHGIDLGLPRVPPDVDGDDVPVYQELAGDSTFESYGQVRHSPARYNVPGRVLIDRSNTFFLHETNLAGALDLVGRSWKPLQELSWASIGNVLTAIQIREARRRDVLVQWRAWRPERFKTARALHAGDRGGTTLSPVVGLHEDVHELDFASLYPTIICECNLSPETVRCGCHDRADVPELGYSVCDDPGVLPDVLQPIVDDRAGIKECLRAGEHPDGSPLTPAEREALEGESSSLKWILVSCFGYQGFSNAKFGRIEVHEAINAYARDILLTAKERLEAGGWRVLHGIVDSLWVTPRESAGERTPLEEVASSVTGEVGIDLEYEGAFDWVAFCPLRDGEAGALTRYFGRYADVDVDIDAAPDDDDAYKMRGIEARQRSTCEWVAAVQTDLVEGIDATRDPERVLDRLQARLRDLESGAVDPSALVVRNRASKAVDQYSHRTRTVAALERAEHLGLDPSAGRDVAFVVVDDEKSGLDRVRLAHEVDAGTAPDPAFYRERVVRAAASVLSPLGWHEDDIESHLSGGREPSLRAFGD
jgi:DNA polymerase I